MPRCRHSRTNSLLRLEFPPVTAAAKVDVADLAMVVAAVVAVLCAVDPPTSIAALPALGAVTSSVGPTAHGR
jgi:hypothetical protein